MPTAVLVALILLVGSYALLMTGAAFRWALRPQQSLSTDDELPTVSVVVLETPEPVEGFYERILACDYPTDRLEIVRVNVVSANDALRPPETEVPVRTVSANSSAPLAASVRAGLDAAQGTVAVATTTSCTVPSTWIRSMVRRCRPESPFVIGPTIPEHNDRVLPRLQALHHLGQIPLATGLGRVDFVGDRSTVNCAFRPDALDTASEASAQPPSQSPFRHPDLEPVFQHEKDAAVRGPSVSSFRQYLRWLARAARKFSRASGLSHGVGLGVWLTHAVLLVCCCVAVALPAWRQPTLLALLGKMGADAVGTVPPVRHYQERGLTRSFVPSELLLVLAIPLAGLLALTDEILEDHDL